MNVSLTRELEQFVGAKVASGRYLTASEVVREGLRLLEKSEREYEAGLQEAKRKIASGLAQARAGRLRDGEEVFAALRSKLSARTPRRKAS